MPDTTGSETVLHYFHIDPLSEHDGPGRRLVLFLQGCGLDCVWCHSPHSRPKRSPLLFFEALCTACGRCEHACPHGVHTIRENRHLLQRTHCTGCGKCIEACPDSSPEKMSGALVLPTRVTTVSDVFRKVRPYLDYIGASGGITFSGGEPLLQYKALAELAKRCKAAGYHVAIETSGIVARKAVSAMIPYIDTWLVGMRLDTGTERWNGTVLERKTCATLSLLREKSDARIIIRIPVVPSVTTTERYLEAAGRIIGRFTITEIDILPYNRETVHYYTASGTPFRFECNLPEAENEYMKMHSSLT
jgi:glycyl-radical enzyme activating protein